MSLIWRLRTWLARWWEDHFGEPQDGWTVTAIQDDIDRAAKLDQAEQTGRHLRREP